MRSSCLATYSLVFMFVGQANASPEHDSRMTCPEPSQIVSEQGGQLYTAPGGWKGDAKSTSIDLAHLRFVSSHITSASVLCRYEDGRKHKANTNHLSLLIEGARLAVGPRWMNATCESKWLEECLFK
ncbi:hypothetical protein [Pseudomonas alabamensis]|uniref:hypothetical protein n=1 Tax=Pseudomonas alabamensis TaxID=3064349 RepID=UPI003F6515B2